MLIESGLEDTIQEVFHGKLFRVVASSRLSCARAIVNVDRTLLDLHLAPSPPRNEHSFVVELQVLASQSQFGLEEALVDGAELAHSKRSEIDRSWHSFPRLDYKQVAECILERTVRQRNLLEFRTVGRNCRIAGE